MTPLLSRATSTATLVRAGWGQVSSARSFCAPHQSRFEKVSGGWRPLLSSRESGKKTQPWQSQTPILAQAPSMAIPNVVTTLVDVSSLESGLGWKSSQQSPDDAQSTVSSDSRASHAPTQMSEDLAERFYDPLLPTRSRRREPALPFSTWTARVQGHKRCRAQRLAPCLDLALAMVASYKKNDDSISPTARQLDCDGDGNQDEGKDTSGANSGNENSPAADDSATLPKDRRSSGRGTLGKEARSGSRRPSKETHSRSRRKAAQVYESEDCVLLRAQLPAVVRGLPTIVRTVEEAVEQLRESQAGMTLMSDSLKMREQHEMKEALYADLLQKDEHVIASMKDMGIRPEDVAELAQIFSELDGHPRGFIGPASLRTVLRRMGRLMTAWKVSNLLDKLWESAHSDEARNERFLQDLDFIDVVSIFGLVIEHEQLDLRQALAAAGDVPFDITKFHTSLSSIDLSFRLSFDHLRRTAHQMGLLISSHIGLMLDVSSDTQLFELIDQCRKLEKLRAHDRAGFKAEEVEHLSKAYHRFVPNDDAREEINPKDLLSLLDHLHIITNRETPEQYKHLIEVLHNADSDSSGTISFIECLHLVRRLFDEAEVHAVLLERTAQEVADLSWEDVDGLRDMFDSLCEESAQTKEFDFVALIKAVRLFGGTPNSEQLVTLERIFKLHALPSRNEQQFHLTFPDFLRTMGELWKQDFAGIFTSAEKWACDQKAEDGSPKVARTAMGKTILRASTQEYS